jgi:hypothetical protein
MLHSRQTGHDDGEDLVLSKEASINVTPRLILYRRNEHMSQERRETVHIQNMRKFRSTLLNGSDCTLTNCFLFKHNSSEMMVENGTEWCRRYASTGRNVC